jgi:HAD superfamily hydrolase (TIGR01509 family)
VTAAILFDFDGTIIDTEWPVYESIRLEFERAGRDFPLSPWQAIVGTDGDLDWLGELRSALGDAFDAEAIQTRRRAVRDTMLHDQGPRSGVLDLLDAARHRSLSLAVASSSPRSWVEHHLHRIELAHHFHAVRTLDDVERAKPAPDLFLAAAEALGVEPDDCVAIEDSPHGATAAREAGARVIVVPNRITSGGDFGAAHLVADSLSAPEVGAFLGW